MMTLPYPYSSSARFYALRLLPGQEVFSQLHAFAQQHQLHAAWIAGCTGSLTDVATPRKFSSSFAGYLSSIFLSYSIIFDSLRRSVM